MKKLVVMLLVLVASIWCASAQYDLDKYNLSEIGADSINTPSHPMAPDEGTMSQEFLAIEPVAVLSSDKWWEGNTTWQMADGNGTIQLNCSRSGNDIVANLGFPRGETLKVRQDAAGRFYLAHIDASGGVEDIVFLSGFVPGGYTLRFMTFNN